MPVQIFQEMGVLVQNYFGKVSLIDLQMAIQAKKAVRPSLVLTDFLDAQLEFPLSVLTELAEEDGQIHSLERCALVVRDQVCPNYGSARMYQHLTEGHDLNTEIFFSREVAVDWLFNNKPILFPELNTQTS